jgi:hypothetical protein
MKYGANTKWCTTTESGMYYARYASRGILIYNINKKTGYKVACFKNLDSNHDNEFSWWDVTDKKIEALDSEAPSAVLEAIRNEIKTTTVANQLLMTKAESDKLENYKNGNGPTPVDVDVRLNRSSSFGTTSDSTIYTGGNTFEYNPSTFSTTSDHTITFNTTSNTGIGNINPSAQLSVHGDMEINGDVILRSDGVERARLTPDGLQFSGTTSTQEYNHFDEGPTEDQRRLMAELRFRDNDRQSLINEQVERRLFPELADDDRARDAQQRLDDEMGAQLAAANERVAERQLSLLENIEMGTLDDNIIRRMQMMAGIKNTKQQIQQLETEIEQLRAKDNQEAQPENVHLSLWNKIKNTGTKLSRTFTRRSRRQIGALPMSVSARLEAVKQSQESLLNKY